MAKLTVKKADLDASTSKDKVVVRHRCYNVTIKGTAPLLFNRMLLKGEGQNKGAVVIKEDPIEKEWRIWREKLHTSDAGVIIPGVNLQMSIFSGAQYWGQRIPGAGQKTYSDLIKSGCIVEDMPISITDIEDERIEPFGTYCTGNVSKGSRGGKVWKIRPRINVWGGSFLFHVYDDRLTEDVLRTIITYAGVYRAVGDWRPRYGRYSLESLVEVESVNYI